MRRYNSLGDHGYPRRCNRVWFVTLVEFFPEKFAKFQSN